MLDQSGFPDASFAENEDNGIVAGPNAAPALRQYGTLGVPVVKGGQAPTALRSAPLPGDWGRPDHSEDATWLGEAADFAHTQILA
ncbi:MAG: hypothetical protein ACREF0_04910, partial [Acetobacteraceae bacterium]